MTNGVSEFILLMNQLFLWNGPWFFYTLFALVIMYAFFPGSGGPKGLYK